MNKLIKLMGLAAGLAAVGGVAAAKDTGPLSKVYAVQEMQYSYQQGAPGEGRAEQARYNQDRALRASEILNSGASLEFKRIAVEELVSIRGAIATQGLATAYKQAQSRRNADIEAFVADAIWRHASRQEFKSREANALMGRLTKSSYPQVRAIGRLADHDAKLFAAKNAN